MSQETSNTERSGLKVKSTLKAGKIALNHNARPRTAPAVPSAAEPALEGAGGLRVQTALRSGFGLPPKGPAPGG